MVRHTEVEIEDERDLADKNRSGTRQQLTRPASPPPRSYLERDGTLPSSLFIGTAGWAIPMAHGNAFPTDGTSLMRYASVFNAAEINSTFYRRHRPSTFERWRHSVPEDFRFSVKVPRTITHEQQLENAGASFLAFVDSVAGLGNRLGPLLLQLPPTLVFNPHLTAAFLRDARQATSLDLVVEPRHASWFDGEADALLAAHGAARAGADPERAAGALQPAGSRDLTYLRLHGSPRVYFSAYDDGFIVQLAHQLAGVAGPAWCIFDNTASGAAAGDALRLLRASRAIS